MTDRIEKTALLAAPVERVWAALTDSSSFGAWFGAEFDGPFEAGHTTTGRIAPTSVDPEVAAQQQEWAGVPLNLDVTVIDPMTRFEFRWDLSEGPDSPTLGLTTVAFRLAPEGAGTRMTIVESGFDAIAADRAVVDSQREQNDEGWTHQLRLIAAYLDRP
jgi:uncharacterized protein YndB with AHSA1/START domain